MFTPEERAEMRDRLLERARDDARITGAALTGSSSQDAQDEWSDVDLFFGVGKEHAVEDVLADWSAFVYDQLGALHHFDLEIPTAIYRAFLLPTCLEIDLAFSPEVHFGPMAPTFKTVFGDPVATRESPPADPRGTIGAWHHVPHARSCIERNKVWQVEYWISGIRHETLTLACLRFSYPTAYGRGFTFLPAEVTDPFKDALVRHLDTDELRRALRAVTQALLNELHATDAQLREALELPLTELAQLD